jgi:hypothetical protein
MTSEPGSGSAQQQADGFASTRWSLVLQAGGDRASPEVQEALTRICSAYCTRFMRSSDGSVMARTMPRT